MYKSNPVYQNIILALLLLSFTVPLQAETIRYVSDSLTIPMRTGTSNRHKIVKFITSGTELRVLEENEDRSYTRVQLDEDKEGWVESSLLMDEPSARQQLIKIEKRLGSANESAGELKQQINELQTLLKQSRNESNQLEQKNQSLNKALEDLRESAAHPIAVAERNAVLEASIEEIQQKNNLLSNENAALNDRSIKEWFMIGAGVSLISLFFGLIIPRINWRKNNSWGGGSF
ncbi:MAG: TIGR04211 family SH3 domain-containing protein [Gammaproteobacteria bacterium]|nr:TIGR04211 family SH3 domain-containing protein [Gammaproteobacteria bacterium]